MLALSSFQMEGTIILIPIIISVLISTIFIIAAKRSLRVKNDLKDSIKEDIGYLQNRLDNIAGNIGKVDEITEIKENMELLEQNITKTNNEKNATNYELLKKAIDTQLGGLEKTIERITNEKISNELVLKDEFYNLKNKLIDFLGNDDNEKKVLDLFDIIDSDNLKTIQWKCDFLNILKEGYVPEIHRQSLKGKFAESSAKKFIQLLQEKEIIISDEIERFQINDDEYWIFDYTKNASQLKQQFERLKIREKEYQEFIGENVELVEPGLKIVQREYRLATGPIDFLCMDQNGQEVGLELKYPKAQSKDVRQLDGYLKEYSSEKNYSEKIRGILVAPEISNKVQKNLNKYQLSGIEVEFNQSNSSQINNKEQLKIIEIDDTENFEKIKIEEETNDDFEYTQSEDDSDELKDRLKTRYFDLRQEDLNTPQILDTLETEFPELTLEQIKEILYL